MDQGISWPLQIGPIGCTATSVRNYHPSIRKIPQQRRFQNSKAQRLLYLPPALTMKILPVSTEPIYVFGMGL